MNKKQQLATGFLAMVIVGSVAFMPVSAGHRSASEAAAERQPSAVVATLNTAELPQEQVRDLTYN
jgi:hypothetical protein